MYMSLRWTGNSPNSNHRIEAFHCKISAYRFFCFVVVFKLKIVRDAIYTL